MKLMYLCVAVGDEHIVWFVQAPRPGTELFLGQLGEGQGGGGGDEHDEEGGGRVLAPGQPATEREKITCLKIRPCQ